MRKDSMKLRALFAALALALALAVPVSAARAITASDATYGGFTTATVTSQHGSDTYVFVQCYQSGDYVYAAYFPVDENSEAVIGPLASTLWPGGPADCLATEGWFTAQGFGAWKVIASTTFAVT